MKKWFLASIILFFSLHSISSKTALIFGITGQDGSYLAEFLLEKGYQVHGVIRRSSLIKTDRIDHLYGKIHLHYGDSTDSTSILNILSQTQPDEIYNLAAQSHVKVSFEIPEYTAQCDAVGVLRILEAIRALGMEKNVRFYQASTSELFGKVQEVPQRETTPFYPRSPYAVAKLYAHWLTIHYREAYGMFNCCGILFNHESPRRGETFITRKVTRAVAAIKKGQSIDHSRKRNTHNILYVGNLDARRDWGYAPEYVEAMWLILQQDQPDDYVIATGETHSVKELIEEAFKCVDICVVWRGSGVDEEGFDAATGKILVKIDPCYFRPTEVDLLIGDPSKVIRKLGWKPKIKFKELINLMVQEDLRNV